MLPSALPPAVRKTQLGVGPRYQGKVRDVYDLGDNRLAFVTTDRLSAFDHVLRQPIPLKGQVLNGVAAHFFRATANIQPNHVLAVPDPNVTIGRKCDPLPIEFVVRGYLAGHAWRVYQDGGRLLCEVSLPEGLRESERLPAPVLTPTTKAAEGHDEDISLAEIREKKLVAPEIIEEASDAALRLFNAGSRMAAERGLLLVDTKYEFGISPDGVLMLIDEVHTPDSSRYYYADGYDERLATGSPQRQLSKEFVREWLIEHGFQGQRGQALPDLPDEMVRRISERYAELYEAVTGAKFVPDLSDDPEGRIEENLRSYLSATGA